VSAIAGLVPWAVSYTTFAPLARMGAEAGETLLRLTRLATAAAAVAAVVIAASSPLSIPLLFGTDYRGAIVPAVVLTLTAVPLTAQLMLARGLAARGEPRLMLLSYGANTLAMAAADVALIPLAGATGAALGSVVGALVGVYVAMVGAARSKTLAGRRPALGDLMPGQDDFRVAVREMRSLARRLVPARGRPA
jgi:O-antigen/teichoic acid export membrane protein